MLGPALSLCACNSQPQQMELPMPTRKVTLPDSEVHVLPSPQIGEDFEIWVAQPANNPRFPASDPPRVLYVLDANIFFGTAVEMTRIMHALFAELPPILVVGIAYPSEDPKVHGELRNRDFTPSSDPGYTQMGRQMDPNWQPLLPEGQRMGGADNFLAYLCETVQPFIGERYRIDAATGILFGSSLGGLFALYTMLSVPQSHAAYIVASPAIWWDDAMLFGLVAERASEHDDLPVQAYFAAGALEQPEDGKAPWLARFKMVSNLQKMAQLLSSRGYPSLELNIEILAGETHTTAVPTALTHGLRVLLAREPGTR